MVMTHFLHAPLPHRIVEELLTTDNLTFHSQTVVNFRSFDATYAKHAGLGDMLMMMSLHTLPNQSAS